MESGVSGSTSPTHLDPSPLPPQVEQEAKSEMIFQPELSAGSNAMIFQPELSAGSSAGPTRGVEDKKPAAEDGREVGNCLSLRRGGGGRTGVERWGVCMRRPYRIPSSRKAEWWGSCGVVLFAGSEPIHHVDYYGHSEQSTQHPKRLLRRYLTEPPISLDNEIATFFPNCGHRFIRDPLSFFNTTTLHPPSPRYSYLH